MHALFLMVLCAGLWPACSSGHAIETLMDNVLVLKVPHGKATKELVPLSCGEAYKNQRVVWKKDGEWIKPPLEGNQVHVEVKEMDGGNYTCHLGPDGDYLNHTVILVRLDTQNRNVILGNQSPGTGHIHCSASNYSGSFHCTWKRTTLRESASVLLVKAKRNSEHISCELYADGSGMHCQEARCSYNEEQHRINLIVYIYIHSYLEVYNTLFYLRDIVRPDALPSLRSDQKVVSWSYPDSWEKPCTYFGLQFQVKEVRKGLSCDSEDHIMINETLEMKYALNSKSRRTYCVRAQDKYTQGPFSPWSSCTVNKRGQECVPSLQP